MRILLVDDEAPSRQATQMALKHLGYLVETADSAERALAVFDPERHHLLLTDNRMPGKSGAQLATELRKQCPTVPIVMYTGFAPPECEAVDRILEKPVRLEDLDQALKVFLDPAADAETPE